MNWLYWAAIAVGAVAVSTVVALLVGWFIHAGAPSEDHRNREPDGQRIRVEKEGAP